MWSWVLWLILRLLLLVLRIHLERSFKLVKDKIFLRKLILQSLDACPCYCLVVVQATLDP